MDYKKIIDRPLSYYTKISFLSFYPMEKNENYVLHEVKGQVKMRKPLFGLFKRKPIVVQNTTFNHNGSIATGTYINDPLSYRWRANLFIEEENAIYRAACVIYYYGNDERTINFKSNEEAYEYYSLLKKRCEEAGVKFPSS